MWQTVTRSGRRAARPRRGAATLRPYGRGGVKPACGRQAAPTKKDYCVPVPVRWMVCGTIALPGESSRMVTVPVSVPSAVGLNVTKSEQNAPGARVSGQLLVKWKSPWKLMVLKVMGRVEMLERLT